MAHSQKYCSNCGAQIDANTEICPKCGVRQPGINPPRRNRIVAAVFALLLGG